MVMKSRQFMTVKPVLSALYLASMPLQCWTTCFQDLTGLSF